MSPLELLLVLLSLVFVLKDFLRSWIHFYRIPNPVGHRVFGSLFQLSYPPSELFKRYRERSLLYFPIFKERVLGFKIVHLIHPEDIKIVLTGKCAHKETRFFVNWLGRSVLNDKGGHRWHYKRKLITPFFNVKVLQDYVTTLREKAKDLVLAVEECEGTVVEVVPYVSNYVSNCVIALTMGKDALFDVQLFNESTNEVKNCVTKRLCTPWMYNDFLYNLSHYGKTEATLVDTIHKITNSVIKCKMKDWKNGVKEGNLNLLEFLLKAKHNGADLDESGIREELVSILMAGHDTTASNLSFVLMLLANHKEVQDRVFEELCSVLGDVEKEPTYEDLQDLKYMHQCIKESLRLYPSVPNLARRSSKIMTTHTGYVIPEDTLLSLGIFDMHHNPNVYPDPEKFDPDRFAPENAKKIHPFAFLPFSGGSRNCIGQKFAILQMKMSLCALLKKFVLKPVDTPSSVRLISSITLNVENGIRVRFLPRIHKELIR